MSLIPSRSQHLVRYGGIVTIVTVGDQSIEPGVVLGIRVTLGGMNRLSEHRDSITIRYFPYAT